MKLLLIGQTSRIVNAYIEYMNANFPGEMELDAISVRGDAWQNQDWSSYDAILHAAGVTHSDNGNVDPDTREKYFSVNRDLAIEVARKAKRDKVKHFVLLSTMMVYGNAAPIGESFTIDRDSKPNPASVYGASKLEGEKGVLALADDTFQVTVIREPVVYGPHFNGELQKLLQISKRFSLFPWIISTKSFIYEENLCECFRQVLMHRTSGTICPSNAEQPTTSELFGIMRNVQGKKCHYLHGLKGVLKLLSHVIGYVNAVFNDMKYTEDLVKITGIDYQICSLEESLKKCLK